MKMTIHDSLEKHLEHSRVDIQIVCEGDLPVGLKMTYNRETDSWWTKDESGDLDRMVHTESAIVWSGQVNEFTAASAERNLTKMGWVFIEDKNQFRCPFCAERERTL